jgi:DNA-directed RNA polymerase subunit RPC12/RpoP
VCPNVSSQHFTAVLLDAERDEGRASVMLKACRCQQCGSSSWLTLLSWLRVSGASGIRYLLGSVTSALTAAPTSSVVYTQPFGSNVGREAKSFCDNPYKLFPVVVGWRNHSGILVVLLKAVDEVSCQHCGLRTTEVKSRHAVGQNRS